MGGTRHRAVLGTLAKAGVSTHGKDTKGGFVRTTIQNKSRSGAFLPKSTPELRAAAQKALANIRATAEYRRDFLDNNEWDRLGQKFNVRLPQWHQGPETGKLERWLRKLGVSIADYKEYSADKYMSDFARLNPGWPLRAFVGLILEAINAGHLLSSKLVVKKDEDAEVEEAEVPVPLSMRQGR